jgi:hypothetical protein
MLTMTIMATLQVVEFISGKFILDKYKVCPQQTLRYHLPMIASTALLFITH